MKYRQSRPVIGSQADLLNTEPFDNVIAPPQSGHVQTAGLRYGVGGTGLRPRCFDQQLAAASNQLRTASIG